MRGRPAGRRGGLQKFDTFLLFFILFRSTFRPPVAKRFQLQAEKIKDDSQSAARTAQTADCADCCVWKPTRAAP